ncbi:hypothetical protein ACNQFN_11495 [Thauera butanivorans]|uniref:hypothetical protein n=1 Tax=Thauera butanivorans TaxID=86174 RepID=UPI003AB650E0
MDTSTAHPSAPIVVESLRPGTFVDAAGNRHTFTRADLDAIAASYDPAVFRSPVVIGHPQTNHPARGWINAARVGDDDRLRIEFGTTDPAFADAVSKKHYRKVSLALFGPATPGNPTPGRWYIRHLGYLGAVAPAVTGLAEADFSGPVDGLVEFSDFTPSWQGMGRLLLNLRDWLLASHGQETADQVLPRWEVEGIEAAARDADTQPLGAFSAPPAAPAPNPQPQEHTMSEQVIAQLREQNTALTAQLAAAQAARIAAAHSQNVEFAASMTHCIPPALHSRLVAVLDALSAVEQPVSFSTGDNATASEPPAAALRAVLAGIVSPVPQGEAAPGGSAEFAAPAADDPHALAQAASELMNKAAREGRTLDAASAVAQVQARAGR